MLTPPPNQAQRYRLGVDVGGTFTDVVLLDEGSGEVANTKVLTTYPDPATGVLDGVRKALDSFGVCPEQVSALLHGTTIATNTLIERSGARTALITTRGFRDVLEIGRQIRPLLFDWFADKPEPFAPRRWRFEVDERVHSDGRVERAPDQAEVRAILDRLAAEGIEALAVCFLFSFLRPEHERLVGELASRRDGLFVSLSCDVLPEYKEYERTSTTVANAYLTPVLSRYTCSLTEALGELGLAARLRLLQSNGGIASVESTAERAVTTAISGPAGGVTAASYLAGLVGSPNLISMDMGGTSCDVCVVRDGLPSWTAEATVAGFPLRTPMINVNAVGAGGGSLIWVDSGGALRVGPRSAGGNPGPACYGRGGEQPTMTDAHVVLGTVPPETFPDKGISLDRERAVQALQPLAEQLGLSLEATALGAIRVVNHNMAQAIRAVSVRKGYDPRDFALVAFGGAGPLHATLVAEELAMTRVILPRAAGVFSAFGATIADFRHDFVHSLPGRLASVADEAILERLGSLEREAQAHLAGLPVEGTRFDRSLDLRYVGQSFEINTPIGLTASVGAHGRAPDPHDPAPLLESPAAILERFHALHEAAYGYADRDEPVELVNVRLSAFGLTSKPSPAAEGSPIGAGLAPLEATGEANPAPTPRRQIPHALRTLRAPAFDESDETVDYPIYDRLALVPGDPVQGPCILIDPNSTALVLRGWTGAVDPFGNVVLEVHQ